MRQQPSFFGRLFGRQQRSNQEQADPLSKAMEALLEKFSKIQYLMEQRALFDVVEKAPVGICITNKNYIYEYVNSAYCRIYGYEYDDLVGNSFTMVVPEEHRAYLMELHDKFMDQEYELEGEWEVVRKDGERISILANAAYVVNEKMEPKKITFVLDRTAEKLAVEKMEDVINRITPVRDKAVALRDRVASDEEREAVDEILSSLDSLLE